MSRYRRLRLLGPVDTRPHPCVRTLVTRPVIVLVYGLNHSGEIDVTYTSPNPLVYLTSLC